MASVDAEKEAAQRPKRAATVKNATGQDVKPEKTFNFNFEKLRSDAAFDQPSMHRRMEPQDFNMDYYHRTGLNEVLVFDCKPEKLGMKMVNSFFSVNDIERLVGGNKRISVIEVDSQRTVTMSLTKFVKYYNSPKDEKKMLYNVLSMEFSDTALVDYVQAPSLVRAVDWAYSWPDAMKQRRVMVYKNGLFTSHPNYPRVENYCLMSTAECYTDFHIDFHGSSVWYHVMRGTKIFWIIAPTEGHLRQFEDYQKNAHDGEFFGRKVDRCARVVVRAGNTLILPSGWIHAVFTPEDSVVFGGNFLHTRAAIMQLRVVQGEADIGVSKRYRYPQSDETVLYHLAQIVKCVTGRTYIRPASRNQQGFEYVGQLFFDTKKHHTVPKQTTGGAAVIKWDDSDEYKESVRKLAKWDGDGKKKTPLPLPSAHDDFFVDDLTFYHPKSFKLDSVVSGAERNHTRPVNSKEKEMVMAVDEGALKEAIHHEEVLQLESLVVDFLNRTEIDVPVGLSRPNSLLIAFHQLLSERRRLAVEEGIDLPSSVLPDLEETIRLHHCPKRATRKCNQKADEEEDESKEDDQSRRRLNRKRPVVQSGSRRTETKK